MCDETTVICDETSLETSPPEWLLNTEKTKMERFLLNEERIAYMIGHTEVLTARSNIIMCTNWCVTISSYAMPEPSMELYIAEWEFNFSNLCSLKDKPPKISLPMSSNQCTKVLSLPEP